MMKILINCSCGNEIELTPKTWGKHSYFANTVNGKFRVDQYHVEINKDVTISLEESFINDLTDASEKQEVSQILNNGLEDNFTIDTELKEIRIDCMGCGEYIVLTEF
ncbi:hypothetical protein FHR92_004156 [Fontibacillus solani]|uniref:Uncharacterized protein n=1 Tax=Fontibacillus solani TaxID=1572857 RepID=A0A7W3SWT2_9BACL|nr:hypothetical protein [Fontibacillus solani]MBA9087671.1 hypothetical protein [Fontibacillus solani]